MRRLLIGIVCVACGEGSGRGDDDAAGTTSGSDSSTLSPVESEGGSTTTSSGSSSPSTSSDDATATTNEPATTSSDSETTAPGMPTLPTPNAGLDYQLGGAYDPPDGVEVLSRDRNDSPAMGLYNICYVNGYQTQSNEEQWWLDEHPDLLLRDGNGDPFIDPDWDEILLDITTDEKRQALAEIVGGWIVQCGADGFDAVEIDNLDTYSRSDGMITEDHAVAYMSLLSAAAHDEGLAIAQKNSTEILDRQPELGTDFAVAEECNRWNECQDYKDVYGDQVYVIEYRVQDFDIGCADFPELSIVLRDLDLVPEGSGGYVFDGC